jgi:hypothetical protein
MLPVLAHFMLLCSWMAGCATFSTAQRAETLGMGGAQFQAILSKTGDRYSASPFSPYPFETVPSLDVSASVGLGTRFDIGGRLGLSGIEGTVKCMVVSRGPGGLIVSVAPSFGRAFDMNKLQIPVLLGWPVGEGHELVLSPRVAEFWWQSAYGQDWFTILGLNADFVIRQGRRLDLIPEVGALYLLHKPNWHPIEKLVPTDFLFQASITLSLHTDGRTSAIKTP